MKLAKNQSRKLNKKLKWSTTWKRFDNHWINWIIPGITLFYIYIETAVLKNLN